MNDIQSNNIPLMSVGKAVETLSDAYSAVINKNMPVKTLPSVIVAAHKK